MKALAEVVVDAAAFLELSADDVVDPAAAVRAHESIVSALADASEDERNALFEYCHHRAVSLADANGPHEQRRRYFYLTFPIAFGLTEE